MVQDWWQRLSSRDKLHQTAILIAAGKPLPPSKYSFLALRINAWNGENNECP
jgi:hypothetical protein